MFSVVNFEYHRFLLRRCVAIRLLAHAPGVGKIAWYCSVRFKECPVTEFLVEKNGTVMNIDKRLKSVCCVSAIVTSVLSRWASGIVGAEKEYGLNCIVVGTRQLMPPDALQPKAYFTN